MGNWLNQLEWWEVVLALLSFPFYWWLITLPFNHKYELKQIRDELRKIREDTKP